MLSIIVPVYNVEKHLPRCIESLVAQKYADIEIVLVDDGSADNCGAICDEWTKRDGRVKVVHKQNGGLVSAWLSGIENSAGELVGFVDSDDFCDDDYFSTLIEAQMAEDADIVIGGHTVDSPDGSYAKPIASDCLAPGVYEGEKLEYIKNNIFKERDTLRFARWLRVFKRYLLSDNLSFVDGRIRVGEDMGIALATLFDSKKVVLVETAGYHYVQHAESIMHAVSEREIENFDLLCANLENICTAKNRSNFLYRELSYQMTVVIAKILHCGSTRKEKIAMLKALRKSEYVARIFEKKDYGEQSFSAKLRTFLFKLKLYKLMTLT